MGIKNQSRQTRTGVLCIALALLLLLASGCGRSEIESTILTTAPETTEVLEVITTDAAESTTIPDTAPVIVSETDPATAPTSEPETEPSTEPATESATEPASGQARDYVLNNNSKKFHYPDCSSVKQIKESNRSDFHGTREELIDRGYSPCGRCKP